MTAEREPVIVNPALSDQLCVWTTAKSLGDWNGIPLADFVHLEIEGCDSGDDPAVKLEAGEARELAAGLLKFADEIDPPVSVSAEPGGVERAIETCRAAGLVVNKVHEYALPSGVEADGDGQAGDEFVSDVVAALVDHEVIDRETGAALSEPLLGAVADIAVSARRLAASAAPVVETGGIVQTTAGEVQVDDEILTSLPLDWERVVAVGPSDPATGAARITVASPNALGDPWTLHYSPDAKVLVRRASTDRTEGAPNV